MQYIISSWLLHIGTYTQNTV